MSYTIITGIHLIYPEILEPRFTRSQFTKVNFDGVEILCTSSLGSLGKQWSETQRRTFPNDRQPRATQLVRTVRTALDILARLDLPQSRRKLDPRIGRSVVALAEALYALIVSVF